MEHDRTKAAPTTLTSPPGWYGRPGDSSRIARWWDGNGWSHITRSCLVALPAPASATLTRAAFPLT